MCLLVNTTRPHQGIALRIPDEQPARQLEAGLAMVKMMGIALDFIAEARAAAAASGSGELGVGNGGVSTMKTLEDLPAI